jgi:hypothetical protein
MNQILLAFEKPFFAINQVTGNHIWYIHEHIDYPRLTWQNHAPVANAGPDMTVYAWIDGKTSVTLNGSGSTDPDGEAWIALYNF